MLCFTCLHYLNGSWKFYIALSVCVWELLHNLFKGVLTIFQGDIHKSLRAKLFFCYLFSVLESDQGKQLFLNENSRVGVAIEGMCVLVFRAIALSNIVFVFLSEVLTEKNAEIDSAKYEEKQFIPKCPKINIHKIEPLPSFVQINISVSA